MVHFEAAPEVEPATRLVFSAIHGEGEYDAAVAQDSWRLDEADSIARALLADGWRRTRLLSTIEEVDALPTGTVILFRRDGVTAVLQRGMHGWMLPGDDTYLVARNVVRFPVLVLVDTTA